MLFKYLVIEYHATVYYSTYLLVPLIVKVTVAYTAIDSAISDFEFAGVYYLKFSLFSSSSLTGLLRAALKYFHAANPSPHEPTRATRNT